MIYDVPRGATIVADQNSYVVRIPKDIFNECGNLEASIRYLNSYFENHPYFEVAFLFIVERRQVHDQNSIFSFKTSEV